MVITSTHILKYPIVSIIIHYNPLSFKVLINVNYQHPKPSSHNISIFPITIIKNRCRSSILFHAKGNILIVGPQFRTYLDGNRVISEINVPVQDIIQLTTPLKISSVSHVLKVTKWAKKSNSYFIS